MKLFGIMIIIISVIVVLVVLAMIYYFVSSGYIRRKGKKKVHLKILEANYSKNNIIDLLEWAATEHPECEALKYKNMIGKDWKTVNYLEYFDNVERFAKCIRTRIPYTEKPMVAIIGSNNPEWFYSHLGTMRAGGISVGIYPTSDPKTCEYILKKSNVNVLVVDDDKQLEKFRDIDTKSLKLIVHYGNVKRKTIESFENVEVIKYIDFIRDTGEFELEKDKIKNNETATVIYTSGTTGNPKGVVIKHSNIVDILNNLILTIHMKSDLEICTEERFISYLPLNHIAAQMMDIYIPIVTLGTVHFAERDALKGSLGKTIRSVKPTVFVGVPRVWEKIMEKLKASRMASWFKRMTLKKIGLNQCKFAITAAAPISQNVRDFFLEYGLSLCDVYGMSESTGPISVTLPGLSREGSVGMPIVDIKFTDENEICVKGKSIFDGYYEDKEITKNAFTEDGWFKTGDLGKVDEDGFLYITGRCKDLIITAGGENVSPIPIENSFKDEIGDLFDHFIVVGDKRKFLSILLVPKYKSTSSEKLHRNIKKFLPDLEKNPELKKIIDECKDKVNENAPSSASTIKKWLILEKNFQVGDELTPTMKLRRSVVQEKYKDVIDALYQ